MKTRDQAIKKLRYLCAWHEWATIPNDVSARACQNAADSLKEQKLTVSEALDVYYRHRGLEAEPWEFQKED